MMSGAPRTGLAAAVAFFAADQLLKWLVVGPIGLSEQGMERVVTSFFTLRNVHNHGVSLGFLNAETTTGSWLVTALTLTIAVAVAVWMWRERNRADQFALGMILGGALGNIVDRVRLSDAVCDAGSACHKIGYVQDYADLHIGTWSPFLNFNLADAAITIGVLVLLARALLLRDKPAAERADVEKSNA